VAFDHFLADTLHIATDDALIHVVFDAQNALASGATDYFNKRWAVSGYPGEKRFVSIAYADSKNEPPLQAADLYAYTWGRYLEGAISEEVRHAMSKLTAIKRHLGLADAAYFRKQLQDLNKDMSGENHIAGVTDGRREIDFREKPQS